MVESSQMLYSSNNISSRCPNLNLPFLSQLREQAKMSMLTVIDQSKDEQITECLSLLSNPNFPFPSRNWPLPQNACYIRIVSAAKLSVSETSTIAKSTLKSKVKQSVHQNHTEYWNSTAGLVQSNSSKSRPLYMEA